MGGGILLGELEPALTQVGAPYVVRRLAQLPLPGLELAIGPVDLDLVTDHEDIQGGAFGCCVHRGALAVTVEFAGRGATRLVTPGGWVLLDEARFHGLPARHRWTALRPTVLVALDERFGVASATAPDLLGGFAARAAAQTRQVQLQLAISQLPRVTDRLVAWFAGVGEAIGERRADGLHVELAITHKMLGEMVGARRPTVSLALRDLALDGRLVAEDGDWRLAPALPELAL